MEQDIRGAYDVTRDGDKSGVLVLGWQAHTG